MELAQKQIAIFKAVIALIDEGADINNLKVSEITNRAGIGKGTAYEYFKSKEEIIVKALLYDAGQRMEEIQSIMARCTTTKDRIYQIFDWIEQDAEQKNSITQLFNLSNDSFGFTSSLKEAVWEHRRDCEDMWRVLAEFGEEGVREGVFRKELPEPLRSTALISQLIPFILYVNRKSNTDHVTPQVMKDFLYDNIIRILG